MENATKVGVGIIDHLKKNPDTFIQGTLEDFQQARNNQNVHRIGNFLIWSNKSPSTILEIWKNQNSDSESKIDKDSFFISDSDSDPETISDPELVLQPVPGLNQVTDDQLFLLIQRSEYQTVQEHLSRERPDLTITDYDVLFNTCLFRNDIEMYKIIIDYQISQIINKYVENVRQLRKRNMCCLSISIVMGLCLFYCNL